jgi:hypothetical protein
MTPAEVQGLIDSALALHGVRLTPAQATAMVAERNSYAELIREPVELSLFEDEPSDFRHALEELAAVAEEPNGG